MPGGFTELRETEKAWTYWITQELNLSQEEFERRGGWELKKQFYTQFFGLKLISWEDQVAIESLFTSKLDLVTIS